MKKLQPLLLVLGLVLGLVAVLAAVQLGLQAAGKQFCLTQLTMSMYYALVVIGLCVVMGYAGQVSLGHGAFFAIGGYTSAVLTTHDFSFAKDTAWGKAFSVLHVFIPKEDFLGGSVLTVSPTAAFAAAMALTLVIACMIGYPALRLRGHYLAMATLGFGLIVYKMVLGSAITGAADGITGVPEWDLGLVKICGSSSARVSNYYFAGIVLLTALLLLRNLVTSRVGRAMQALHDGETTAGTMAIDTASYKLKAFVVSAILAALAGVLFTHYTGGIAPSQAGALQSVRYVALAAVGGMANLWGGAIISTAINFFSLRGWFGSYDNAVFGALLIAIVSLTPEGPLKPMGQYLRRQLGKRPGGGHGVA